MQPSVATSTTNVAVESALAPNQEDEDDVMAPASAPVSSRINGSARVSTSPNVQMEDAAVSASAPEPEEDVNMAAASASTAPNQEPAPAAESTASNQTSSTEEGTEFNAVTLANNARDAALQIAASDLSAEEQVDALFNLFDETKAPPGSLENDVMKMCGLDKGELLLRPMDGSSELLSLDEELISNMPGRIAAVNAAKEGGLGPEINKAMKGKKTNEDVWGSLVVECNAEVQMFKLNRGKESKGEHAGEGLNDNEYETITNTVCKNVSGDSSVSKDEVVALVPTILRILHDLKKDDIQDDDRFKLLPKECQVAICTKLDMDWEGSEDESEQDDSSEEGEEEDGSGSEDNSDRKLLDADNEDEDQSW